MTPRVAWDRLSDVRTQQNGSWNGKRTRLRSTCAHKITLRGNCTCEIASEQSVYLGWLLKGSFQLRMMGIDFVLMGGGGGGEVRRCESATFYAALGL